MFLENLLNKLVALSSGPKDSGLTKLKGTFILAFTPPIFALLVFFVAANFFQHDWAAVLAYSLIMAGVIFNSVFLIKTKKIELVSFFATILALALSIYLIFEGGVFGEGHVWIIILPVIVFLLQGSKRGLYWILFTFFILFAIYLLVLFRFTILPYPNNALGETLLVFVFSTMFSFFNRNLIERDANEQEKYRLAVENSSDHIVITDPDAKILYANPAASKITGYSQQEMLGQNPRLWGGNMSKSFYEKMWQTIKFDKETFHAELNNKRKNGEFYIADVHISPVLDNRGKVIYFVAIERDITKEKEIDRMKTEFVSLASHQLRTPLASIKWFLEILRDGTAGKLTGKQTEYLNNVYQSNEAMIKLVNSLLNISRIESGRLAIEPQPTDLSSLAKEVVSKLSTEAKEKHIGITIEVEAKLPKINIDPKLISNVFQNLLTNGIRYSTVGGKIEVAIKKDNGYLISEVSDSGIGIPKADQSRVFERFFRGSNVVKEAGGTGLGLYLTKEIIEASGGKIWFESAERKGTSFWFSLPLAGSKAKKGGITLGA